jgi:hypothetical protein
MSSLFSFTKELVVVDISSNENSGITLTTYGSGPRIYLAQNFINLGLMAR